MKCKLVKNLFLVGFLEVILTCAFAQQNIPSFLCDGVPVDQYVRNISDCRGWIRCIADGPVSGFCPEPFFFDEVHQFCSTLENVECYSCPQTNASMAFYPVPKSCNRFIRCLRNVATEHICDPGLQFNNGTQQCVESDANCTISGSYECPTNLKPGEFYAMNDAANCSIGLVCIGNPEPRIIECSDTLHFNKLTLMCGRPKNSACTETNTTTTTISSSYTTADNPVIQRFFELPTK